MSLEDATIVRNSEVDPSNEIDEEGDKNINIVDTNHLVKNQLKPHENNKILNDSRNILTSNEVEIIGIQTKYSGGEVISLNNENKTKDNGYLNVLNEDINRENTNTSNKTENNRKPKINKEIESKIDEKNMIEDVNNNFEDKEIDSIVPTELREEDCISIWLKSIDRDVIDGEWSEEDENEQDEDGFLDTILNVFGFGGEKKDNNHKDEEIEEEKEKEKEQEKKTKTSSSFFDLF